MFSSGHYFKTASMYKLLTFAFKVTRSHGDLFLVCPRYYPPQVWWGSTRWFRLCIDCNLTRFDCISVINDCTGFDIHLHFHRRPFPSSLLKTRSAYDP